MAANASARLYEWKTLDSNTEKREKQATSGFGFIYLLGSFLENRISPTSSFKAILSVKKTKNLLCYIDMTLVVSAESCRGQTKDAKHYICPFTQRCKDNRCIIKAAWEWAPEWCIVHLVLLVILQAAGERRNPAMQSQYKHYIRAAQNTLHLRPLWLTIQLAPNLRVCPSSSTGWQIKMPWLLETDDRCHSQAQIKLMRRHYLSFTE